MKVRGIERHAVFREDPDNFIGENVGILIDVDRDKLEEGMAKGSKYFLRIAIPTVQEIRRAKAALLVLMRN